MLAARDNPFAVHRVLRVRYRLAEDEWAGLLARLATLDHRAAIVGPHGSGKTTLIEDLAPRLEARGFRPVMLRLDAEQRRLKPGAVRRFGASDFILLDGAEQVGYLAWPGFRRTCAGAAGLVITTHQPGRLPTLHECSTTPELLAGLVTELGESLPPARAAALFAKHSGNLRDCLRELYDAAATSGWQPTNLI